MAATITGYQWGDDKSFIGPYTFENNLDKKAVHLPPNTTLKAPPTNLPASQEAAWDGTDWLVRNVSMSWMIPPPPGVVSAS